MPGQLKTIIRQHRTADQSGLCAKYRVNHPLSTSHSARWHEKLLLINGAQVLQADTGCPQSRTGGEALTKHGTAALALDIFKLGDLTMQLSASSVTDVASYGK